MVGNGVAEQRQRHSSRPGLGGHRSREGAEDRCASEGLALPSQRLSPSPEQGRQPLAVQAPSQCLGSACGRWAALGVSCPAVLRLKLPCDFSLLHRVLQSSEVSFFLRVRGACGSWGRVHTWGSSWGRPGLCPPCRPVQASPDPGGPSYWDILSRAYGHGQTVGTMGGN